MRIHNLKRIVPIGVLLAVIGLIFMFYKIQETQMQIGNMLRELQFSSEVSVLMIDSNGSRKTLDVANIKSLFAALRAVEKVEFNHPQFSGEAIRLQIATQSSEILMDVHFKDDDAYVYVFISGGIGSWTGRSQSLAEVLYKVDPAFPRARAADGG